MSNKLFLSITLAALSITLGACSKNAADNNPGKAVNKQVIASGSNSINASNQPGGQVTVINGSDKNTVKVRSTGFR